MGIITIFENANFKKWIKNNVDIFKKEIFKNAFNMMLSITSKNRLIDTYKQYEEILFENLNIFTLSLSEISNNNSSYYKTVLADSGIFINFSEEELNAVLDKYKNINKHTFSEFINKLANYTTDASIVQWKIAKDMSFNTICIENKKNNIKGFFPIAYDTYKIIKKMEDITSKKVIFSTEKSSTFVKKDFIQCTFGEDRLFGEYFIQSQLFDVYLYWSGFEKIDKYYFNNKINWTYTPDNLKKCLYIIIQTLYKREVLHKNYKLYNEDFMYTIINSIAEEEYLNRTKVFLCEYLRNKKVCLCEHVLATNENNTCSIIDVDGFIIREIYSSDLSTPELQSETVNNILDIIKKKEGSLNENKNIRKIQ